MLSIDNLSTGALSRSIWNPGVFRLCRLNIHLVGVEQIHIDILKLKVTWLVSIRVSNVMVEHLQPFRRVQVDQMVYGVQGAGQLAVSALYMTVSYLEDSFMTDL